MGIPIVDCKEGGIWENGPKIFEAISTIGFVYLKNCGFNEEEVSKIFKMADDFWALPDSIKQKFARPKDFEKEGNTGYVAPNVEFLNPKSAAELRESFNYSLREYLNPKIDEHLPKFCETIRQFYDQCWLIGMQILRVLAINLGLSETFFAQNHSPGKSFTTIRLLHYPPLPSEIEPGTVRCGEHSDYGSITLLFQDQIGGLEVFPKFVHFFTKKVSRRDGTFIQAQPVPGAVLINTGDLLQRWTADRIMAVRHRVLIPNDGGLYASHRRSIAFFMHPDDQVLVKPLDGSQKYEPVTAHQHLIDMFKRTY